jgi:hypothetical protein
MAHYVRELGCQLLQKGGHALARSVTQTSSGQAKAVGVIWACGGPTNRRSSIRPTGLRADPAGGQSARNYLPPVV